MHTKRTPSSVKQDLTKSDKNEQKKEYVYGYKVNALTDSVPTSKNSIVEDGKNYIASDCAKKPFESCKNERGNSSALDRV